MATTLAATFVNNYYSLFNADSEFVDREACANMYATTATMLMDDETVSGRSGVLEFFQRAELAGRRKIVSTVECVDSGDARGLIFVVGTRYNTANGTGQPFHEAMSVELVGSSLQIFGHIEKTP
jgi:hypothetical protein